MEEVSEVFKNGFLGLYKTTIQKNYQQKTLKDRVNNFNNARRECRDALISKRRQIDEKKQIENQEVKKRLDALQKWKIEKQRQKEEEKKKTKPVFKVHHVDEEIGLPNLENVNKQIKGKSIKVNTSHSHQSQFAPPNHKFNAPASIKPIYMHQASKNSKPKSKIDFFGSSTHSPEKDKPLSKAKYKETTVSQRCTRAMTRNLQLETKKSKNLNCKVEANKKSAILDSVKPTNTSLQFEQKGAKPKTKDSVPNSLEHKNKQAAVKTASNVKIKQMPTKKSKTDVRASNKEVDSGIVPNIPPLNTKRKGKKLNIGASEVRASPTENSDSVKSSKMSEKHGGKSVGWNGVEIVGEASTDSTIKTPKGITKKYNKTPRKRNIKTSNVELHDESNDDVEEDNLPVSSKIIEELVNDELKTIEIEQLHRDCDPKSHNDSTELAQRNNSFCTPVKTSTREASPVYISPFVTISRGKNSARKEYRIRQSVGDLSPDLSDDILKSTSPKAGATYFLKKLNNEISRIHDICNIWSNYKNSNELPEEATDMIDVAIGQSNLLISKKFQQFRNLIEECRNCEYIEKPVTCEDLHGFWDMLYIQVEDLDKRFNNLNALKANNWQEIIPEKPVVKRGRGRPKKASANPVLKNLIKAARDAKKLTVEETQVSNSGDYTVKSPINQNRARRSLRVSLLSSQTKSRASSSPGLTMMKISQAIKSSDGMTPGKSILKSDLTRSAKRITKSVLFKDNLDDVFYASEKPSDVNDGDCDVNKENDINEINLITFSPVTPTRRSKRLSKIN